MATVQTLRKTAKDLGVPAADVRKATTAADLSKLIAGFLSGNGNAPSSPRKTTVRKAASKPVKATPARKQVARKAATPATPAKKATPARASKPKAVPAEQNGNGDAGRAELADVDYSRTEGWNAREGSAPARIIATLRKFKGNRGKTYDALRPTVWDFVGKKLQDGTKRSVASAEEMLRYRISRTAWDFAMKTGQHTKASNRAEYGKGTRKNTPKKATPTATKAAPAKKQPAASRPAPAKRTPAKPVRAVKKKTTRRG